MHAKAFTAYVVAWVLSAISLVAGCQAVRKPWLINSAGDVISLWKFSQGDSEYEFPTRSICYSHNGFCASWKTATFLFTLVLVPELLALLALLFSFMLHHRKKTVLVVNCMCAFSLLCQLLGLQLWKHAFQNIDQVMKTGPWNFTGGHQNIIVSLISQCCLLFLMVVFRSIVRRPVADNEEVIDSDEEYSDESEDTISVPEDIPPEQIDFYIFNKTERRRRLAATTVV